MSQAKNLPFFFDLNKNSSVAIMVLLRVPYNDTQDSLIELIHLTFDSWFKRSLSHNTIYLLSNKLHNSRKV